MLLLRTRLRGVLFPDVSSCAMSAYTRCLDAASPKLMLPLCRPMMALREDSGSAVNTRSCTFS